MKHEYRISPEYFEKILKGEKNHEVRLADVDIQEGDRLVLKEHNPETREFTGREIEKVITHIDRTKALDFYAREDVEKYGFQILSF